MNRQEKFFIRQLLLWNDEANFREMPWKGEKDPYRIWLSEIILQQTRVEQGRAYYERFIENFPTVAYLAKAPETKVFKLWEGLGYYTRCKNLVAAAKQVHHQYKDRFPHHYEEILALPGIGPYTAAAIASFAFNLPHAVLDGNVFRVLSRFFGLDTSIDSTEGKKMFSTLAAHLLDKEQPGRYNQAIMDFGAVVCKPKSPLCSECYLRRNCIAFNSERIDILPVKEKKIRRRERWFNYIVAEYKGKCYVRKRGVKDIWENLYEFILIESPSALSQEELWRSDSFLSIFGKETPQPVSVSADFRQQLTHQTIHGRFYRVKLLKPVVKKDWEPVPPADIRHLPFPRMINMYQLG